MSTEQAVDLESLREELFELASKIDSTMREVATIRHPMMQDDRITTAVDELGAIVAATEVATTSILDAAERLEQVSEEVRAAGSEKAGEDIVDAVTQIYEACNFQDITGQRVNRVMVLLREIDERLITIISEIGEERFATVPGPEQPEGDHSLLNGPAIANNGLGQASIDALFG